MAPCACEAEKAGGTRTTAYVLQLLAIGCLLISTALCFRVHEFIAGGVALFGAMFWALMVVKGEKLVIRLNGVQEKLRSLK